jgi:hypothetical protein
VDTKIDPAVLNDYANSMFRFEQLNEPWLAACTHYCQKIFGNSLHDKVVLDYAFGRGNWSVALLRAGAKKVYAVDASIDNVDRFRRYLQRQQLTDAIEPIHGNLVEAPLDLRCDVFWLYGILHHIPQVDQFLHKLKDLRSGPTCLVYAYYYPDNTPRACTVKLARRLFTYDSERSFREDEALYLRAARIRARDDLVAPHVDFLSAHDFGALLGKVGVELVRQDEDFFSFQQQRRNIEFIPHQFFGVWNESPAPFKTHEPIVLNALDLCLIDELGRAAESQARSSEQKRKMAIGLFNTHFGACGSCHTTEGVLFETALYLGNLLLGHCAKEGTFLADFLALLRLRLSGESVLDLDKKYRESSMFKMLMACPVRL